MITLSEANHPYVIDSITTPLVLRNHWFFNAKEMDFFLQEVGYLEEFVGPTMKLLVGIDEIEVPASWTIMMVDRETYTVDMVPVTAAGAFEHDVFVFSPSDSKLITEKVRVIDYNPQGIFVYPSLERTQAVIHAIGPGQLHGKEISRGVLISPNDLWRHISGSTVGDILN
jgi:hypothetical protein